MKPQIEDIWNSTIKGNQWNWTWNSVNFNEHLNPKTLHYFILCLEGFGKLKYARA